MFVGAHGIGNGGSRRAIGEVIAASQVSPDVVGQLKLDKWFKGGALGALGDAANSMAQEKRPPVKDRVRAVHRSALTLSTFAVVDAVSVGEWVYETSPEQAAQYFDNATQAFLFGESPELVDGGPRRQQDAYDYAREAGTRLRLNDDQKGKLRTISDGLRDGWLNRLTESRLAEPNATAILDLGERSGRLLVDAAAVVVTGEVVHPALQEVGGIGGVQEERAVKGIGYLRTYTAARGTVEIAHKIIGNRQLMLYGQALDAVETRRQRRIVRSVTAFATNPYIHPAL